MNSAIFLDRDGVINAVELGKYTLNCSEFRFLPRARNALRFLAQNFGGKIAIVTNQSPLGRGCVTRQQIDGLHTWMLGEIARAGGRIDRVYVCPHTPKDNCRCRKPKPGLFLRAARELDVNLSESVAVGDTLTDVQAARAAGILECYRVCCGLPLEDPPQETDTYTLVGTLAEAAVAIMARRRA